MLLNESMRNQLRYWKVLIPKESLRFDKNLDLEKVEKDSPFRTFVRWLVYIISFTLVPRNSELDRLTKAISKKIGQIQQCSSSDRLLIERALKNLKSVIHHNAGSKVKLLNKTVEKVKAIAILQIPVKVEIQKMPSTFLLPVQETIVLKINEPHLKVNEPIPEIKEPAPKVNDLTPEINETTPTVNEPTTDVNQTVPEVNETTPKVNEPITDINQTVPEINEQATVLKETSDEKVMIQQTPQIQIEEQLYKLDNQTELVEKKPPVLNEFEKLTEVDNPKEDAPALKEEPTSQNTLHEIEEKDVSSNLNKIIYEENKQFLEKVDSSFFKEFIPSQEKNLWLPFLKLLDTCESNDHTAAIVSNVLENLSPNGLKFLVADISPKLLKLVSIDPIKQEDLVLSVAILVKTNQLGDPTHQALLEKFKNVNTDLMPELIKYFKDVEDTDVTTLVNLINWLWLNSLKNYHISIERLLSEIKKNYPEDTWFKYLSHLPYEIVKTHALAKLDSDNPIQFLKIISLVTHQDAQLSITYNKHSILTWYKDIQI